MLIYKVQCAVKNVTTNQLELVTKYIELNTNDNEISENTIDLAKTKAKLLFEREYPNTEKMYSEPLLSPSESGDLSFESHVNKYNIHIGDTYYTPDYLG